MNITSFPKDFREKDVKAIFDYVLTGKFCQLVSVPGGGKATLLKLIVSNQKLRKYHLGKNLSSTRIIYLDLHHLPSFDRSEVEKFILFAIDETQKAQNEPLLLSKQLNIVFSNLIKSGMNVVFLLDHFDEFQNRLGSSFFQLLKGFRTLNKYKFGVVFGTRRDLKELTDRELLQNFYDFFTDNLIFMKIYDQKATETLFAQVEQAFQKKLTSAQKETIVKLTGGHAKLTKLLAESCLEKNSPLDQTLIEKPLIQKALEEIWDFLTPQEQQVLNSTAHGKDPQAQDALENLIKFDLIKKQPQPTFTIALFQSFVKEIAPGKVQQKITYSAQTKDILKGTDIISDLLSPQEYRLLRFLVQNEGKILTRGEIIEAVWPDSEVQEGISDEAIDQMVYRIRKKIEDDPTTPKHITTVVGRGLRFQS